MYKGSSQEALGQRGKKHKRVYRERSGDKGDRDEGGEGQDG